MPVKRKLIRLPAVRPGTPYRRVMRSVEHELIGWALNETAGNRSAAARLLKMPRNTLLRRMRVLKLQRTKRKRRRTKQY